MKLEDLKNYTEFRINLKYELIHTEERVNDMKEVLGKKVVGSWEEYYISKELIEKILKLINFNDETNLIYRKGDLIVR